ncbi:DUF4384 domain-containing protein [Deinococcus deserti]|uniref:Putative S-layer-like protein array-related protein n=1 Tax=Deinococcus deserti (strain DSM 17065 / CIP 109153 / LMG 22923 / VCD115) TaxID=546414 RepID=C1CZW6_DEIDV|nr:DUF4384 domain-containing protein [Deinococcus deserti]ACO45218.1 putative S-layer-like protein array-related protein [Deinococcus deserti VCD115]
MKNLMMVTGMLGVLAALGVTAATPTLSAQSIIVNPVANPVNVRVWTDRDPSGSRIPEYAPGEKIRLYTTVSQDSYVYLFNVDPNGTVDLILPNRYQGGGNFLKANTVKAFPESGDPFTFDIAAPYGVNKVLALASRTPLNIDQIATFKGQQSGFASVNVQGQNQLAQALSIVVRPVEQNTWDSATAFYTVVNRAPVAVAPAPPVAAPLTTAPARPGAIQPLPQASAPAPAAKPPQTAQALSIIPNPASPWGTAREWKTTLDTSRSVAQVHAEYASLLKAEGYSTVDTRTKNTEVRSEYRNARGGKAELSVKKKGKRIEVKVERK